jgi:hypothetical protein
MRATLHVCRPHTGTSYQIITQCHERKCKRVAHAALPSDNLPFSRCVQYHEAAADVNIASDGTVPDRSVKVELLASSMLQHCCSGLTSYITAATKARPHDALLKNDAHQAQLSGIPKFEKICTATHNNDRSC